MLAAKPTLKHTFVTVAYGADYGLMRLQARSLNRYLDPSLVAEIIVVENFGAGPRLRWRDILSFEYGKLAGKVRFVKASAIAAIPITVSGWFAQQILKLMVSSRVTTEYYVILDGKNHLVHPLISESLIGLSGKPRSYLMNYEYHPMRRFFENTLSYFGVDPLRHLKSFLPVTTPFIIPTVGARSLVSHVERREKRRFPDAFLYDGYKRSEFFLFGAYILFLSMALADVYEFSAIKNSCLWPESSPAECTALIAANEEASQPFFAVHRRIIPRLSDQTRIKIAAFWYRHGLFPSLRASLRFLADPGAG